MTPSQFDNHFETRVLGGLPVIVGFNRGDDDIEDITLFTLKGKWAPWAEDRMTSRAWADLADVCNEEGARQRFHDECDYGDYLYEQRRDA